MYKAETDILIKSSREKVWNALTEPALIEQYFLGTKVTTDWRPGGSIVWTGEWEGKEYKEWGNVEEFSPQTKIVFNYFSPASGLEDKPENYNKVTYTLTEEGEETRLSVTQENIKDQATASQSEQNWKQVLEAIKTLLEK